MKVVFFGLGGAGQRLLRLIANTLSNDSQIYAHRATAHTPLLNDDFTVSPIQDFEKAYNIKFLQSYKDSLSIKPDKIVISNPTALHVTTALPFASEGTEMIVEKPLGISYEECNILSLTCQSVKQVYINFQRRFHPCIYKLREILESNTLGKIRKVQIETVSNLREWHPYEDYRSLYAMRKDLGGGVLLTECHELDLMCWLFGLPTRVSCQKIIKCPQEQIEVELACRGTLHYTSKESNFNVAFSLDMFGEFNRRILIFSLEFGRIELDLNTGSFSYYNNIIQESFSENLEVEKDGLFVASILSAFNKNVLDVGADLNCARKLAILLDGLKSSLETETVHELTDFSSH